MKRYSATRAPKPRRKFLQAPEPRPATLGEKLFSHTVLIIGCVLLPGFCMLVAPLSVVRLSRAHGEVAAEISKRVWFVIPYRHLHVEGVTGVDSSFHSGTTNYSYSDHEYTTSESSATLQLTGRSGTAEVEVSPANIDTARRKVRDFLDDPASEKLSLTVVANWKFSVIAGGFLSLLTLLYVVGVGGAFLQSLWRLVRVPAARAVPEEARSTAGEGEAGNRLA